MTKRTLLKSIARVFDPLGLAAPFVVRGKTLMQELWAHGLDWHQEVDPHLKSRALKWIRETEELSRIQVKRWLLMDPEVKTDISLHVFVDASSEAYGTVAYMRRSD